MKKSNKILAVMLAVTMALGMLLTGCGETEEPEPDAEIYAAQLIMPNDEDFAFETETTYVGETQEEINADGTPRLAGTIETKLVTELPLTAYVIIPVVTGVPAADKINAEFRGLIENYFADTNPTLTDVIDMATEWVDFLEEEDMPSEGNNLEYTHDIGVITVTDEYVSLALNFSWWMGGTNDYGMYCYTFDAVTGEPMNIRDFVDGTDDEIIDKIWTALEELDGGNDDIWFENMNDRTPDMFDFFIDEEGNVRVQFDKYEMSYGAYGAFDITI